MKKFIFSKFGGLEAYSQQRYYQMNSFTGIFRQHFKLPPYSPHVLTYASPHQILRNSPMFATPVGNSVLSHSSKLFPSSEVLHKDVTLKQTVQ